MFVISKEMEINTGDSELQLCKWNLHKRDEDLASDSYFVLFLTSNE
jgi:hypothetical protein